MIQFCYFGKSLMVLEHVVFMTESWLKNEDEERKRAAEEATKKEEEERNRNVEADIKKRKEESESMRLTGSQKDQQIIEQINSSRGPRLEKSHQ